MKQVNKDKRSITLDTDVAERIQELADREDRSFSQQVNKILKEYLREKEGEG